MAWTKLDDTTVVTDQPLSSFVGSRLTQNVGTYVKELQRLTTFAYPTTSDGAAKVKWASYNDRRGTVVTVDCGLNASVFRFKVFYKTTNADLGGTLYVRDVDSGNTVQAAVPGSASVTSLQIPFFSDGARGLRGFHISFESDVGDSEVGIVELTGGVNNQVFCEPFGSPAQYPFTLATGYHEMYHLMELDAGSGNPAPATNALLRYQVCAFKHNTNSDRPPHGVLMVWPSLEVNPPVLTTNTTGAPKNNAKVYELGRLELFSITVENSWQSDYNVRPPAAYQQPTPITQLLNYQDAALLELQPNACTNLTTSGYLGCVLPAKEEATFAFFVQTFESVQQLLVSFRAVAYNLTQQAPDITFGVRDYQGNPVGNDITHPSMPVPRVIGQTTVEPQDGAAVFMNGVLAGDAQWGMRDAMDLNSYDMSYPVRFTWGPNLATEIAQGSNGSTDAVYYGTISATSDLYIFGFNCKVR